MTYITIGLKTKQQYQMQEHYQHLSAQLINDPAAQGYKFVAVYSNDRFGLYNCGSLVEEDKKAINFRYWTIPNQEINHIVSISLLQMDCQQVSQTKI